MMKFRMRQAWTIARIEMRRAFFSKRAFWVYLLALLPAVIFLGHGIETKIRQDRWSRQGVTPAEVLDSFQAGDTEEKVMEKAPKTVYSNKHRRRKWVEEKRADGEIDRHQGEPVETRWVGYYDGQRRVEIQFENGVLTRKNSTQALNFDEDRTVYAGVFQFFYLRLAIFFGCLGIFMNLFRGEMLDRTIHYWFLAPARREVLLIGKYLAGLVASTVIFTSGAALSFVAMLWPHQGPGVETYWASSGPEHLLLYSAAAALGCLGYGSVFVAAGLLVRNPIIPAAVLLVWESINGFLPDLLQKLSVLYYVQSLCPTPAPIDNGTPALVRMLLAPAAPASRGLAVLGLMAVTCLVLWVASAAVRRIEVNYSTE